MKLILEHIWYMNELVLSYNHISVLDPILSEPFNISSDSIIYINIIYLIYQNKYLKYVTYPSSILYYSLYLLF